MPAAAVLVAIGEHRPHRKEYLWDVARTYITATHGS